MPPSAHSAPLRWPAEWRDPALLELVRRTPIDSLVMEPAPELSGVREAARAAGLAVVSPQEVRAAREGVWPRVQRGQGGEAGPTGLPWIDSNGWWLRLARARAPEQSPWVGVAPPADDPFLRPASYALALADAFAHGGRWVVALDPKLRAGLAARNETALAQWQEIASAIAFFKARQRWHKLDSLGAIGVLSSFTREDEFFAGELLNLMARRGACTRILLRGRPARFDGLRAIVYADQAPPGEPLGKNLMDFAARGGVLLAPAKWPLKRGAPTGADTYRRFDLYRLGKGQLAVSRDAAQDPYVAAGDAQLLMGNRYAAVKFFNAGTLLWNYTGTADGCRAVLHIVNYAMRAFGGPVSVAFTQPYRTARIQTLERPEAAPLELHGNEVHLPRFGVYAGIELERRTRPRGLSGSPEQLAAPAVQHPTAARRVSQEV